MVSGVSGQLNQTTETQRVRPGTCTEALYRDAFSQRRPAVSDVNLKLLEVPFTSARREPANVENGRVQDRQREKQSSYNAWGDLGSRQVWSPGHLRYLSQ